MLSKEECTKYCSMVYRVLFKVVKSWQTSPSDDTEEDFSNFMTTKRRQHTLVQRHTAASVHKSAIRRTKWRLEEAGYQPKCCVMSVFGTGSLLIVAKKYYWPHSSIKSGSRNKQSVCILYHIHIYITIDKCLLSTKSGSLNARVQYSNM